MTGDNVVALGNRGRKMMELICRLAHLQRDGVNFALYSEDRIECILENSGSLTQAQESVDIMLELFMGACEIGNCRQ